MKLIVDIDEKLLCAGFKRHFTEEERNILIRAIGNGTLYEERTQGDLISREALRKETENLIGYSLSYEAILNAIDNAPTVEPCYQTTSCIDCKNYDKENHNCPRYCEVIKEAINSRPQGDLISREALKKNCISCFSEWCSKESRHCEACSSAIVTREMIDNAPTVGGEILTKLNSDSAVDIDGFGVNGY